LILFNGKSILLTASMNKTVEVLALNVDTGNTYTQIDSSTAARLGLKSHPRLVGTSQIGDGSIKVDYLCQTTISIMDITAPLVVKVGPNQPSLLGLDAMFRFSMILNIPQLTFEIDEQVSNGDKTLQFIFINFEQLMARLQIGEDDLKPVQDLPPPQEAYKQQISAGGSNYVLDLGSTLGFSSVAPFHNSFGSINLGK